MRQIGQTKYYHSISTNTSECRTVSSKMSHTGNQNQIYGMILLSLKELCSPTAAIAVTGGVALLSHSSYNAIMLEPESPELDSITLFTKRHLQPPGMLTNLHSLPSRQGIVGTGVCTAPPLLAAAPSCRYLKQGCQPTVACKVFGEFRLIHSLLTCSHRVG